MRRSRLKFTAKLGRNKLRQSCFSTGARMAQNVCASLLFSLSKIAHWRARFRLAHNWRKVACYFSYGRTRENDFLSREMMR